MIRLRRYASRLHAEHAAMRLRERGITATVVGDYVNLIFGGPLAPRMLQVELMLLDTERRDEAEAVLAEFESEPIELDPGWEDQAFTELAGADLSAFDLECPTCAFDLAGLEPAGMCPECGGEYDAAMLIVARYGPEALAAIFEDAPAPEPARRFACRECRADLTASPTRGRCPSCGRLYDKDHE